MRILILTSCTGKKKSKPKNQLTIEDFRAGNEHLKNRTKELQENQVSAKELYTGGQHLCLMRALDKLRSTFHQHEFELKIVSAGYGLLNENEKVVPYEVTFSTMGAQESREWGEFLKLHDDGRKLLGQYDLTFFLLGKEYLRAIALPETLPDTQAYIFLTALAEIKNIPQTKNIFAMPLGNPEAKIYGAAVTSLKGRVLEWFAEGLSQNSEKGLLELVQNPSLLVHLLREPKSTTVSKREKITKSKRPKALVNPKVDKIINLSDSWRERPHRKKLNYFIPEWDDLVDPDYDFLNDIHSGGSGNWNNEVYAHQMYPEPNYDGLLVSRAVAEKSKSKKELINKYGVHRLLRVPKEFPIMGDCGAFDYIMEEIPPYTTDDVLNYYTDLGFDFGVSVDHLIVKATMDQWQFRYDLTINNAEEFLKEHRARDLKWTPVGAVQGWDPSSYAKAAQRYVKMGYKYLGLGGLVRSTTKDILYIVDEVRQLIPREVRIHLFGIARPDAIPLMVKAGIDSIDSASHLRRAWLGAGQNYFTENGTSYTAIRIPQAGKSFRAKRIVSEGRASREEIDLMETKCLKLVRAFDRGQAGIDKTLDALCAYDELITENRNDIRPLLEKLLNDQPWKQCPCDICQKDGVEVIIFRGNNRNRRRGFHNTYIFYKMLQKAVEKGSLNFNRELDLSKSPQIEMNLGL